MLSRTMGRERLASVRAPAPAHRWCCFWKGFDARFNRPLTIAAGQGFARWLRTRCHASREGIRNWGSGVSELFLRCCCRF